MSRVVASSLVVFLAVACSSPPKRGGAVSPTVARPSYGGGRPVYILPRMSEVYVPPGKGKDGGWHEGYTTVVEVEPARLGSQEEAELMGLPFVTLSDMDHPSVPAVQRGGTSQDLNATTIAQKLAAMSPSEVSISNQGSTPPPKRVPISDRIELLPVPPESSAPPPKVTTSKTKGTITIYPGGVSGDSFEIPVSGGVLSLKYAGGSMRVSFNDQKGVSVPIPTTTPFTFSPEKID